MENNKLKGQMYDAVLSDKDSEETIILKIEKLLTEGIDVNHNLGGDFTPLHFAVTRKKSKVCRFLIDKGANPHIENFDNVTALDLAAGRGDPFYDPLMNNALVQILKSSNHNKLHVGIDRTSKQDMDNALVSYNQNHALNINIYVPHD